VNARPEWESGQTHLMAHIPKSTNGKLHRRVMRANFVQAATFVLSLMGLPDEIVDIVLNRRDYAADVIRRVALDMITSSRASRMSIRWFRMHTGCSDPVFVCNHSWHWIDPNDVRMSSVEEFITLTLWINEGRPVPPYVPVAVSASAVATSKKRHIHYRELNALQRSTGRAKRVLPHRWEFFHPGSSFALTETEPDD